MRGRLVYVRNLVLSLAVVACVHQPRRPDATRAPGAAGCWRFDQGYFHSGADSVTVSWYNGLSGPTFRLAIRGDFLRGVVRHLSDVAGTPIEWKPASAVRMTCPASRDGGT